MKLYALKRATTHTTLKKICEYTNQFGTRQVILSDNRTQFTTPKQKDGLAGLHIKPRFTAIRNPCNNIAERINRQLGNFFRMFM